MLQMMQGSFDYLPEPHLFQTLCASVCVCVCVSWRIPALSGVFSSEASDEFSTVAGEVTTPLHTGHNTDP